MAYGMLDVSDVSRKGMRSAPTFRITRPPGALERAFSTHLPPIGEIWR
jgi:hypothetical protein